MYYCNQQILTFLSPSLAITCQWCVVSASPVGLAEVTAIGPVWSIKWHTILLSGIRMAILSGFPMYFAESAIPRAFTYLPVKL
jgi:hypothetical protein